MSSPWIGQKITSPTTRLFKGTCDPHVFWLNELREIGPTSTPPTPSSTGTPSPAFTR